MTRKITLFLLFLLLLPAVVFAQPTFINPTSGVITSPFGWRIHPITGASRFHSGIDIADDYYTPVVASAPGVVTHAGWIDGYGNAVIIEHEGGWSTLYGHFAEIHVTAGQTVSADRTATSRFAIRAARPSILRSSFPNLAELSRPTVELTLKASTRTGH